MIAYDPFLTPERAMELGVEKVELDQLLARADFITLHTPLTDQTRNILSAENLAKTKQGRADHQLRARRPDRRGGAEGRARQRPCRRRRARRVRRGAGQGQSPVRRAGPGGDAASRRLDHRGAGQRRDPGRRADVGLSGPRRRHQRAQHALALGRGGAAAQALYGAGREARQPGRPGRGAADQRRLGRGRGRRRRSSTRSRSPARCWPG